MGDDGTFLGELNCSRFDFDDIASKMGSYGRLGLGNENIFYRLGRFGNDFDQLSPYNPIARRPPSIIEDGVVVGRLTKNASLRDGIDTDNFLDAYLARCE